MLVFELPALVIYILLVGNRRLQHLLARLSAPAVQLPTANSRNVGAPLIAEQGFRTTRAYPGHRVLQVRSDLRVVDFQ